MEQSPTEIFPCQNALVVKSIPTSLQAKVSSNKTTMASMYIVSRCGGNKGYVENHSLELKATEVVLNTNCYPIGN